MSQLVSESRIVETVKGDVLEITFHGIHQWTHENEMNRYIEGKIAETLPAAILFNLLDYEYAFGNDVTGLFTASFYTTDGPRRIRPVCIVATRTTHKSLYKLFKSAHLLGVLDIGFAPSLEQGLQYVTARLSQKST